MDIKTFSKDGLNNLPKDMIIKLYLQLSSACELISEHNSQIIEQNKELSEQNKKLIEQSKRLSAQIADLQESVAKRANHRF